MNQWRNLMVGCSVLIGVPLLILIGLLLFAEWAWGGSIKPSLDAQYVPTAEYLLQYKAPIPSFMRVYPDAGAVLSQTDFVAITVVESEAGITNIRQWTNFYINNQRVAHDSFAVVPSNGLYWPPDKMVDPTVFQFNLNNRLNTGLHLFRIQIGSSPDDLLNPDPKFSYEWAYRVE